MIDLDGESDEAEASFAELATSNSDQPCNVIELSSDEEDEPPAFVPQPAKEYIAKLLEQQREHLEQQSMMREDSNDTLRRHLKKKRREM